MTWREDAVCRTVDPDLFFPDQVIKGVTHPKVQAREAKAICAQCPVRQECLSEALLRPEPFGIWGGTTEQERVNLRRQRSIKLPAATREPKWLRDYQELVAAGWTQMQIWRSKGVQMEAFLRQLRVYGIPKSAELERYLAERQWVSA